MMLAAQALTVQSAVGDRLALGIGLSHQFVIEHMWGYSFDKPVRHMREYLDDPASRCSTDAPSTFKGEALRPAPALDDRTRGAGAVRSSSPRSARRCCGSPGAWPTARSRG